MACRGLISEYSLHVRLPLDKLLEHALRSTEPLVFGLVETEFEPVPQLGQQYFQYSQLALLEAKHFQ